MRRLPKDRWKTSICRAIEIWCVISSGKSNGVDFELHKILIHCDATNITRVASKCGEKYLKYSERLTLSQSVLQCNDMTLKCCDSTNASCDKFISLWEPIWMFNLCPQQWDDDSVVTTMSITLQWLWWWFLRLWRRWWWWWWLAGCAYRIVPRHQVRKGKWSVVRSGIKTYWWR